MVESSQSKKKDTSIVDLEHQFHHHHIDQGKSLEYANEFQPVITSNPTFINRGEQQVLFSTPREEKGQEEQQNFVKVETETEEGGGKKNEQLFSAETTPLIPNLDKVDQDYKTEEESHSYPLSIPTSMKAIVAKEALPPQEHSWDFLLLVHTYPTPSIHQIEPDQVLVKMHAASLNPIDFHMNWKEMAYSSSFYPHVCGRDGSGEIVYMGSEARKLLSNRLTLGDQVLGVTNHENKYGTFAQYAIFQSSSLARKPKGLSWEQAAALPVASLTMWKCLAKVPNQIKNPVQRSRPLRVLIHGASGGFGSIAVLLAKYYFMADAVYATCSEYNMDYVKRLGADRVIDIYKSKDGQRSFEHVIYEDWSKSRDKSDTSNQERFKGFINVVIDTVGAYDLWDRSCELLDQDSYFCSVAPPRDLIGSENSNIAADSNTSLEEYSIEEDQGNLSSFGQLLKFGGKIVMEKLRHWAQLDHPNFNWITMDEDDGSSLEHVAEFLATREVLNSSGDLGERLIDRLNLNLFELSDVRRAYQEIQNHHIVGKAVLKIDQE